MFKKIKTTRLGITEQTVVFDEIADLIEANDTYSEYYKTNFVRTEIQQKAKDIITYSELPPGEVLHLLMYGSVGSGKTWNALSIVCDTLTDHPGSTALFVRRTYNEIKDALYKPTERFLDQFNLGYRPLKTPPSIHLHNGSEFRFRSAEKTASSGSDKADDLGGTAFSIAVIDEADEVPEEYAKTVAGRMREKTGVQKKVIIYICNPPSEDHWLYEWFFENSDPEDPKSKYRAIRMPIEGNREHLPEGYIESVHKDYAHNPALYLRMVRGEFGPAVKGFPIFSKFFERERHVATVPISENWNDKYPLQRCWDFGWNRPACVVFQDDLDSGQIRIYRAFLGSKIILEAFRNQMLHLCETAFPGAQWEEFVDPAGVQKTDKTHLTSVDILKAAGLKVRYRASSIEYGLSILSELLSSTIPYKHGPRPAILLDPSCGILADAFEMGYCADMDFDETSKQTIKVVKDGYYEHVVDALRYGLIHKRRPNGLRKADYTGGNSYAPVGKAVSMPRGQYAQNFQSYSIHTQDVTRGLLSKSNARATGRYNFGGNKWTV